LRLGAAPTLKPCGIPAGMKMKQPAGH